jgi:hypothetical protein
MFVKIAHIKPDVHAVSTTIPDFIEETMYFYESGTL